MSHNKHLLFLTASLMLPTLSLVGCATPDDTADCASGKCDIPDSQVPDSPCDGIITDQSGARHAKVAGRNNDALSKLVFQTGNDCPASFQAIMAKLRETDKDGCTADERAGLATRFVYDFHFYHHVSRPYIQRLRSLFLEELRRSRPRFIVQITAADKHWVSGPDTTREFPELHALLDADYGVVASGKGYVIHEFGRRPAAD